MVCSHPCALATAALASVETLPMTLTPSRAAHCVKSRPTPPAAACRSTVSPDFSPGAMRRRRYDVVRPRIVIAAAVSNEMVSGSLMRWSADMTRSVLYAPSGLPV